MKQRTVTRSTEVFVLRTTQNGYNSAQLSHPRNTRKHRHAVLKRAREVAFSSDSAVGLLTISWRS